MAAESEPMPETGRGLSALQARILQFERSWWRHAGAKEAAIRSEFGLSAARYYQLLNALLDSPEAVRHDPMLVGRLQRARDARTRVGAARAFTLSDHGGDGPHDPESTD